MNILLLWGDAMAKGYAAPILTTYKQAHGGNQLKWPLVTRLLCLGEVILMTGLVQDFADTL